MIIPLHSIYATITSAGGKGANLARLLRSGFPVPPGFIVATDEYCQFLAINELQPRIDSAIEAAHLNEPQELERVSAEIRAWFTECEIPPALRGTIASAYGDMGSPAVAVRSSATAEDLPHLSFAGQQETCLNVAGLHKLYAAIRDCWSSLWTARAIGYRARNSIPSQGMSIAVIVQEMAESVTSGVMFTANPLNGLRRETHIDANFGLGEALVSGRVEPDHYVVDKGSWEIVSRTQGKKELSLHSVPGGGIEEQHLERSSMQALHDEAIVALARMGDGVQELFSSPQDIEWVWTGDHIEIVQARPITSLFPLPQHLADRPLKALASFGAIQGMLDPITPLGQSVLKTLFAAGGSRFGMRLNEEKQTALYSAGARLWVNLTPILRNTLGRRLAFNILRHVEPTILQAIEQIREEKDLKPARRSSSLATILFITPLIFPLLGQVIANFARPALRRQQLQSRLEELLVTLRSRMMEVKGGSRDMLFGRARLSQALLQEVVDKALISLASAPVTGIGSWMGMRLLKPRRMDKKDWEALVMRVARSVPHNPTTEMDFSLWRISQRLRGDPQSRKALEEKSAEDLSRLYRAGELPAVLADQLGAFLQTYGARGLAEIDLGRQSWKEEPSQLFHSLRAYLQNEDANKTTEALYRLGSHDAAQAAEQMQQSSGGGLLGRFRQWRIRMLIDRARQWMGMREYPKFFMVRVMDILRTGLLESGLGLQREGILADAHDIFYLSLSELARFARDSVLDNRAAEWRDLIQYRREEEDRENRRVLVPRLILSDGRAFYGGLDFPEGDQLRGSPVSPGYTEGVVRVVINPLESGLQPGEIMVCPGTDPSWTPLFLSASGLIMEVGGMMTHGAVVAREYGLPAVVGVNQATTRLKTGMRISLDSNSGLITILENPRINGETNEPDEIDSVSEEPA